MRVLAPVLAAHFLAAFAALGMPLFLPRVLADLAPHAPAWLTGALYVLPASCTALTAPAWGRLADRFGRKLSLQRAQTGLAFGFVLAGFAPDLAWFTVALVIQGGCGGSLAAANAYLATQWQAGEGRPGLVRALDWTQFSARLALVTAPFALGLAVGSVRAQTMYRVLAWLPLVALLLTTGLPADTAARRRPARKQSPGASVWWRWRYLLAVQGLFCFALVVTFPYFLPYCAHLGVNRAWLAGLLFSLPHLVYLAALPWWRGVNCAPRRALVAGLTLFTGACLLQALISAPLWIAPARVLMGLGMLQTLSGLNRMLGQCAGDAGAGHLFGVFDACGKGAGACAGVAAGLLASRVDVSSPFTAGALAALAAATMAACLMQTEPRNLHVQPSDT